MTSTVILCMCIYIYRHTCIRNEYPLYLVRRSRRCKTVSIMIIVVIILHKLLFWITRRLGVSWFMLENYIFISLRYFFFWSFSNSLRSFGFSLKHKHIFSSFSFSDDITLHSLWLAGFLKRSEMSDRRRAERRGQPNYTR